MTLNREQYIWLEQRNRDEEDVLEDKKGLYILMNDIFGVENMKIRLPLEDKRYRI